LAGQHADHPAVRLQSTVLAVLYFSGTQLAYKICESLKPTENVYPLTPRAARKM